MQPLVLISFLIYQVQLSTPLYRFLFHQDLQMAGCNTKSYTGLIHLACAMKCLDTKKCPSFVYIPERAYCEICADGYTVTGLTFLTGSGAYLARNVQDFNFNLPLNNVEKQYNFPGTFLPSELFYLRAVMFGSGNWWMNLYQGSNIFLHFRRRNDGGCPSPCHAMNSLINGAWGNERRISDFPYVNGKSFELHVLFQSSNASIYFNRHYIDTYTSRGIIISEASYYLGLYGNLFIEEVHI